MRLLVLLVCLASALGFVAPVAPIRLTASSRAAVTTMGAAKDGPFTPVLLAAKVVLGEPLVLKLRGKGIAYHAQYINGFCAECQPPARSPPHISLSPSAPLITKAT